jgi:hypothetical protein
MSNVLNNHLNPLFPTALQEVMVPPPSRPQKSPLPFLYKKPFLILSHNIPNIDQTFSHTLNKGEYIIPARPVLAQQWSLIRSSLLLKFAGFSSPQKSLIVLNELPEYLPAKEGYPVR